jgi:magnesium-transporting ATPase (P-type)
VITIAFGLFFSFLWNIGHGENTVAKENIDPAKIDKIISSIILGSVVIVYVAFCLVQFTYLFARAGLPAGMTFAEYAREGFAQTVAVCAINLLIFGIFMWRGDGGKLVKSLLAALLTLTGIMIVSGAVRLAFYIGAFGMTWLRLLSAWFIIYLAAVVILCVARLLFVKKMPVIGICTMLLLVWYVALGFLNPDGFISWYNSTADMLVRPF